MAETYEIVTVAPRTRSEPGGQFVNVQSVTFKTKPSGLTGMVDIPAQVFSATEVDRIVVPLARELEAVKNL